MAKNKHIGSSFDDFLDEEGLLEEATAVAIKRVLAWELDQAMKARNISKTRLAAKMGTSRAQLDRILSETDTSLTIKSLSNIAQALRYRVNIELVPA
jgi:DNA-binding Xre family transcriptional regulator